MGIMYKFKHPECFQGHLQRLPYFEGWYYKFVDATTQYRLAVIPGISIHRNRHQTQAFIQLLYGLKAQTHWINYPISSFAYQEKPFRISIADNFFSLNTIHLDICDANISLQGDLLLSDMHRPRSVWGIPSVMGPFAALPCLECYHNIISMNHTLQGHLRYNGQEICWDQGKGYLEKDHGHSFPKAWLWLQGNHFRERLTSLSLSIARVPLSNYTFTGFIVLLTIANREYRFTSYNGARVCKLSITPQEVNIILQKAQYRLQIKAIYPQGGDLLAPIQGSMTRKVNENINTTVAIQLTHTKHGLCYADTCHVTSLEICGDLN